MVQLFVFSAHAEEVRSRPVGYLVQTIPAGQTRSFSVPFDATASSLASSSGALTAVGTNYLENSAATWTPGAFSTVDAPYFVRLTSGAHAGRSFRIVTPANTATRLYVSDDGLGLTSLSLDISSGSAAATATATATTATTAATTAATRFEIIPGDTLATFFGTTATGDSLVVHGAGDPIAADLIQVWGGAAWLNFYYNTVWQRWARDTDVITDPSRNHFLLRSDRGLMLTRRASTALALAVLGRVLTTPQRAVHTRTDNALTFLATMQAAHTTLGTLALQTSPRAAGWRSAPDSADADILLVWNGATWFSFFHNSAAGHWQRIGDPANRDDFELEAGTPVFVRRHGSGSSAADKTINFPASGT